MLRIVPVPCLSDNYAYLVIAEDGHAAVVDPSEAAPVREALAREGARLVALWLTHHHWDHVGGVEALVAEHPGIPVLGSAHDAGLARIPCQTGRLDDGDAFAFEGHEVHVMAVPGHTLGAIAYVVDGNVFSGDTLFLAGCGRVFEGTMPMMAASMAKLRALPDATRIYCGHEYTRTNLRFAQQEEPENDDVVRALADAERAAGEGRPTVPGTIAHEKATNPFFRFDVPSLAKGLGSDESFARLREAKNRF